MLYFGRIIGFCMGKSVCVRETHGTKNADVKENTQNRIKYVKQYKKSGYRSGCRGKETGSSAVYSVENHESQKMFQKNNET